MTAPLPPEAALFGREGELISLSVATEPKHLEDLLEALASLDFPVNPQLYHRPAEVLVEFPAYSSQVEQVRNALLRQGLAGGGIQVSGPLVRSQSAKRQASGRLSWRQPFCAPPLSSTGRGPLGGSLEVAFPYTP